VSPLCRRALERGAQASGERRAGHPEDRSHPVDHSQEGLPEYRPVRHLAGRSPAASPVHLGNHLGNHPVVRNPACPGLRACHPEDRSLEA